MKGQAPQLRIGAVARSTNVKLDDRENLHSQLVVNKVHEEGMGYEVVVDLIVGVDDYNTDITTESSSSFTNINGDLIEVKSKTLSFTLGHTEVNELSKFLK